MGTSIFSAFRGTQDPPIRLGLPPTPTLTCHGLISESEQTPTNEEVPKPSLSTMDSYKDNDTPRKANVHRFIWANIMGSNKSTQPPSQSLEVSASDNDSFVGPSTPQPLPNLASATPISPRSQESGTPSRSRLTSWQDSFIRRFSPLHSHSTTTQASVVDIHSILRHPDGSDSSPMPRIELVNSRGQNIADVEMVRTRDKIRRQLRFLFIYPLVYIGMWVVPFVSHVLQYDDRFVTNPPFGLSCAATIFVCSQAAVDCWLFSTREKPWKSIPGNDGSFWGSLRFWSGRKCVSKRKLVHGPGKTRDEMIREARVAYRRRDEELAQRRIDSGLGPGSGSGTQKGEREWWENSVDPETTPVAEARSNPVEDIVIPDGSGRDEDATLTNVKTRRWQNTDGLQQNLKFVTPKKEDVHVT